MNTRNKRTSIIVACSLALCLVPAAFANKDADKHFKKMDTDGDGKVSRAEHTAAAKQMFTESDTNADGIVSASELNASMAAKTDRMGKPDKTAADKIKEIDQDGDGQLTTAEHEAGSEQMFAKMDKDGDGSLSKEECAEGMKMKRDA